MSYKARLARYLSCFVDTAHPEAPVPGHQGPGEDLERILFPSSRIGDPSPEIPVSPIVQVRDRLDEVVEEMQGWKRTIQYSRPSSKDITKLENNIKELEGAARLCKNALDCSRAMHLSLQLLDELKKMEVEPVPSAYVLQGKQSHIEKSHAYAQILKPLLKKLKQERENLKPNIARNLVTNTHPDSNAEDTETPKSKIAKDSAQNAVPGTPHADDSGDRPMKEDHSKAPKLAAKPVTDLKSGNPARSSVVSIPK